MGTLALMDAEQTDSGAQPDVARWTPAGTPALANSMQGSPHLIVPEPHTTDELLVKRLVAGDERALAAAYDQHSGLVYGLARRVTRSDQAAEDITQEVFTSLWERPERVDLGRGTLRAFLGVLTHRRAVDLVRKEEASRARAQREHRLDVKAWADVSDDAIDDDTARRVRRAVDSLPPEQREAILLAYFGGRTYREVAETLAIPEGTAKSRLRLGLTKLHAALQSEGVTPWA